MGRLLPHKGKRAMLTTDQDQRFASPALGRALAHSQDRTASEHELADHQEVFGGAGPDAGGTVPHEQTGSFQAHHRRGDKAAFREIISNMDGIAPTADSANEKAVSAPLLSIRNTSVWSGAPNCCETAR